MDTITFSFSYLLPIPLLLLPLSLYLFFIGRRSHGRVKTPPGSPGWPMIGEMIDYALSGPENFVMKRMCKFSPYVFQTCLMGEKVAFFCGPQGNKFFFTNGSKVMTSWFPQSMKKTLLFPEYVDAPLGDIGAVLSHRLHRMILKPDNLKLYIPIMDSLAREHLEKHWSTHSEVKVFPLSKLYTFRLACKLFMGIDDPQIIERLMKNFNVVTQGIFSIPIDFPGTGLNHAIKAGALVREDLLKITTLRKKELMEEENVGKDLLSSMILQANEKGEFLNEMEVVNNIIGILLGSYDPTGIALTFVLKNLSERPDIYERVLAEQMEISKSKSPGELLNWDDVHKMTYTWNVLQESLRLGLPANGGGSFREAITDFTFAGFTIPKGWKTFWTVHTTHSNPNYFPNPEKFDPSRFERNVLEAYTFVPFGGGPHLCPGREYAKLEVLVFVHNVVNTFKLEKLIPDEKILYHGTPVPVNGLPVRLLRH